MSRTVFFLLSAWTAVFAPAVACSRNNEAGISVKQANDSSTHPAPVLAGPVHAYLALGDSYTIGTSIAETGSYPFQTVTMLQQMGLRFSQPYILARNGWTTTDLLAALADTAGSGIAPEYDMVTLLIGVNNQYQGGSLDNYKQEFSALLDKSIAYAGNRAGHVIVLSIPDYSVTPFGQGQNRPGVAAAIDAFNNANKAIAAARGAKYLDVTGYTRTTSLFAADSLHYSPEEYAIWAKDLAKLFRAAVVE